MDISRKLELVGLLVLFVGSLVMIGLSISARSGNAEPARATTFITEANASPIEKKPLDEHPAKPGDAEAPVYLDLGARY